MMCSCDFSDLLDRLSSAYICNSNRPLCYGFILRRTYVLLKYDPRLKYPLCYDPLLPKIVLLVKGANN